jgi:hypothetical protein
MEPDRENPAAAGHKPAGAETADRGPAGSWPAGSRAEDPWAAGADPAGLRNAWRRRSQAGGWLVGEDWHTEAVDAVITATYLTGTDAGALLLACARLGRSRAKAGIGIAETIDDLAALFAVLGQEGKEGIEGKEPPLHLVCSIAEGWAEEGLAQLTASGCEDPLSGLATVPYLRTRLAEVYREAAQNGTSPADTHRLLVVRLPRRAAPWPRMALAILVGHDLRAAFPGGETLSLARQNGTGLALALVGAGGDLPFRYARLRRTVHATFGTQIRMTPLPGRLTEALRLVDQCLAEGRAP